LLDAATQRLSLRTSSGTMPTPQPRATIARMASLPSTCVVGRLVGLGHHRDVDFVVLEALQAADWDRT
jgi:hypothetical protein